jgi:hypothetical protein
MDPPPTPEAGSAGDLLLRAAGEVALCRLLIARIEDELAPLIATGVIEGRAPQAIDLLDQTLGDLATLFAGLARALPEGTTLTFGPVLALLRLDDVRRRMSGDAGRADRPEDTVALF